MKALSTNAAFLVKRARELKSAMEARAPIHGRHFSDPTYHACAAGALGMVATLLADELERETEGQPA